VPEPHSSSAAAQESSGEIVSKEAGSFPEVLYQKWFNAFPVMAMVLDAERQIVYSNQALLDFVGAADAEQVRGLRPGAALGCVHAAEPPDGCTTTEFCAVCGGRGAISSAQIGRAAAEPYRLRRRTAYGEEALDLYVWSTPVEWGGARYTLVCVTDVGDRLRRHALERSLFQAAFRLAERIERLAGSLARPRASEQQQATVKVIAALSRELIEELQSHSDLAAAERGDLEVCRAPVQSLTFLRELVRDHAVRAGKPEWSIRIDLSSEECEFTSDPALVRRVVGHMLENAAEACAPGETITVGCRRAEETVEFWVHNPGAVPEEVRLQMFQRSFTTKGPGRGLGTYMMRLLSGRYLGGSVSFRSAPEAGTVFTARYPLSAGEE
jgi:signal transduction histidine kinase